MALKIRLTRMGSTHRPFYRLIVIDSRSRRDGRAVCTLGYYNPLTDPAEVKIEADEALSWLQKGAQPSDTAKSLLKRFGIWQRFQLLKQGKSPEEVEAEVAKILEARENKQARKAAETAGEKPQAPAKAGEEAKPENGEDSSAQAAEETAEAETAGAQEPAAAESSSEETPAAETTEG